MQLGLRKLYSVTIDRSKFRERFTRYAVFVAPLFFWGRKPWLSGLVVVLFGVLIRAWAAGYLHKDKAHAVRGPYLFVRHPLYLGSCLLAAGFILALHHWLLTLILGGLTVAVYAHTINHEESNLLMRFGDRYRGHMRLAGPLWPKWPGLKQLLTSRRAWGGFSFKQYMKNREYECLLGVLAILAYILLSTRYPNAIRDLLP